MSLLNNKTTKEVGRNEFCPCGSGKKYKNCCGKDQNVISFFSEEITTEEAQKVRGFFTGYFMHNSLKLEEKILEKFDIKGSSLQIKSNAMNKAFAWAIMDYYPFEGGKSFFDLFLIYIEKKIDRQLFRKLKSSWKHSYLSVYEILDDREEGKQRVKDIFTGEEKVVALTKLFNFSKVGDTKVTRLVPVDGGFEYFFGSSHIPTQLNDAVVRMLLTEKERKNKTWETFLKEDGEDLVQLLVEEFFNDEEIENEDSAEDTEKFLKDIVRDAMESPFKGYTLMDEEDKREFLSMPQEVLGGKTPITAAYSPEMKKDIREFLKRIREGKYDKKQKYEVNISEYVEDIEFLIATDTKVFDYYLQRDWQEEIYLKEAELFIQKTKGKYFPGDIIRGLEVWRDFMEYEGPRIEKQGIWASAVNHLIDKMYLYDHYPHYSEVAKVYGVDLASMKTNSRQLFDFLLI